MSGVLGRVEVSKQLDVIGSTRVDSDARHRAVLAVLAHDEALREALFNSWRARGFRVELIDEEFHVDRPDGQQVEGKICQNVADVEACIVVWNYGDSHEDLRAEVATLRSALDNANGVLIATKDAAARLTKERDDALRVSIARVSAVIRESVDEAAKQLARNVSALLARDEVLAHPTCDGCTYNDQGFEPPCNTCDKTDYARGVGTDGMGTDNWTEKK